MAVAQALKKSEGLDAIDDLIRLTGDGMAAVNALILERAASHVDLIPELSKHLIASGGKRLRPMLTLASAELCGASGRNPVLLAAAVEFMHTATLLHDDVVDESEMRRGSPTARMIWGNKAAVLVGDYLLGQAFRMMVEAGSLGCLDVLSRASAVIAEGEVMQLGTAQRLTTTEADYMAVIEAKTAALFAAATEVGAVLANRPAAEREALATYGMTLGTAFQLVDDALDYSGSQALLGKRVGDDLREGKVTLPVVLLHERGSAADRALLERTIVKGEIGDGDLDAVIAGMERTDALRETIARAEAFGAAASGALEMFPETPVKAVLADIIAYCINRAR